MNMSVFGNALLLTALFLAHPLTALGETLNSCYITDGPTIMDYSCNQRSIVIPRSIRGVIITAIGTDAFSDKDLTSVNMPDSVMTIGVNAFASNNLTTVVIPNSVRTIAGGAFAGNRLTRIVIPDSVASIGVNTFTYNDLRSVVVPAKTILQEPVFDSHVKVIRRP